MHLTWAHSKVKADEGPDDAEDRGEDLGAGHGGGSGEDKDDDAGEEKAPRARAAGAATPRYASTTTS